VALCRRHMGDVSTENFFIVWCPYGVCPASRVGRGRLASSSCYHAANATVPIDNRQRFWTVGGKAPTYVNGKCDQQLPDPTTASDAGYAVGPDHGPMLVSPRPIAKQQPRLGTT